MTRADAKAAMDAGKKIGWKNRAYAFYDLDHEYGPYVFINTVGCMNYMTGAWGNLKDAYILPERKTRPCTQLEILAIQTKPNRVVRRKGSPKYIWPSQECTIDESDSGKFEWAEFNPDGTLGPWHDFVVEEEV